MRMEVPGEGDAVGLLALGYDNHMPEPQPPPNLQRIRRIAFHALVAGVIIMLLKFGVFWVTDSAAVLADAMESIINLVAAGMMIYSLWLSSRPADRDHPYGHGKVEFMAVGLEGWMILLAGLVIGFEGVRRLISPPDLQMDKLNLGSWLLGGVALLVIALGLYVWIMGRKHDSQVLIADGKHLLTDAFSTLGGLAGLILVQITGKLWLDPVIAIILAGVILFTSWRLLWHGIDGLMDRTDPKDDQLIRAILDQAIAEKLIQGYHKVRHRHTGSFHWVDMHLQVDGDMTVRQSHTIASTIENRIETQLGQANATAHMEPLEHA